MNISPQTVPIIQGHEPVAANALIDTSDWVKLTNCKGVYIIVHHYSGGGDTDLVLTVHEGATGAGTSALATAFPIWVNTDTSLTDTMVKQTDAVTYTIDTTAGKDQIAVFYIDGSILTEGYDWIQLGASGGNAANYVSVLYMLDGARYQQATPPTAIA